MAEKIRPPHLPPTSASSQQPLLVPPAPAESSQAVMSLPKLQQVPGLHPQAVPQPDVALHARPATSTVTGTEAGWAGLVKTGRGLPGRGVAMSPAAGRGRQGLGRGWGVELPALPSCILLTCFTKPAGEGRGWVACPSRKPIPVNFRNLEENPNQTCVGIEG